MPKFEAKKGDFAKIWPKLRGLQQNQERTAKSGNLPFLSISSSSALKKSSFRSKSGQNSCQNQSNR